jgi:phospholipase/carboxylesterase
MSTTINEIELQATKNLALTYLVRKPQIASTKQKAIILLHGVGSNEQDMFGLAYQLPADYFVIAARGPLDSGPGRYAWYSVDFSTGKPVISIDQEAASRALIRTFIDQVRKEFDLQDVYLGGFSQGAIMSYSMGLTQPEEVQGIVSLSGRILDEIKPFVKKQTSLESLRIFVAHGVQDNILPIHYARSAKQYLEDLSVDLTYQEYPTGHQISNNVMIDLNSWLG